MSKLRNTVKKGRKAELEYAKMMEKEGYSVIRVDATHWFWQGDFLGLFDLICFREDGGLLIQVKSNGSHGAVKKLAAFKNHPSNLHKQVAVRYDGGKWKVHDADEYPNAEMRMKDEMRKMRSQPIP